VSEPVFYAVTAEVNPVVEAEWSRCVAIDEVESRAALEAVFAGDAVKRLRADFQARYGSVTRVSRQALSPVQVVE